jgi:hypothetical protein
MEETSQLLGIRRATLWILAKQGDFPLFHIQKRVFVCVKSLLEWIRMKEHPEAERSTTVMASQKKLRRESFQEEFSSEVSNFPLRVCLIPHHNHLLAEAARISDARGRRPPGIEHALKSRAVSQPLLKCSATLVTIERVSSTRNQ